MTTMFFAHGTGVRRDGYTQTLSDITKGMARAGRADVRVVGISWGEMAGVNVTDDLISRMIPAAAAMGDVLTTPEEKAALWATLMDDPLFELRLIALKGGTPQQAIPGQPLPSDIFKSKLRALPATLVAPAGGVASASLQAAVTWLADGAGASTVTEAAAAAGSASDPILVSATADALVAYMLSLERGEPGTGPDALYVLVEREALVGQIVTALFGNVAGLGDWFKKKLTEWALAKATSYGRDRRSGLMNVVSPGVGDILLTQRSAKVVDLLADAIRTIEDDVVVIGHSLGGVHLVNLLSRAQRPANVTKLITVGSQSAFFTACAAMENIAVAGHLPAGFPPWLNVYDRSDFLSFRAQSYFSGAVIRDHEVSSGVSFPDSHGAYWRNPALYREIAAFL